MDTCRDMNAMNAAAAANPLFDPADARIKEDILRMIVQYLQGEGYHAAVQVLQVPSASCCAAHRP
eukprot:SAG11_NODE_6957_length_1219_cov_2.455357_2_plen_65_part_00